MANRYAEAALNATRMETYGKALTPLDRWNQTVKALYSTSPSAQRKTAPKGAYLGLCEAGLVQGIPPGKYGATMDNKNYAIAATALLAAGTHRNISALWAEVTQGDGTEHQGQMDIVLALWKNNLILSPKKVKTEATPATKPTSDVS